MNEVKANTIPWMSYSVEFLSVFIAVIAAFALNNWNDERKQQNAQNKILTEIYFGLENDLEDIAINKYGHEGGNDALRFFKTMLSGEKVNVDSFPLHYFNLTRDFISIQNTTGYETLKSRGLELIDNDSLRKQIISLYEYHYAILEKFEETYSEAQFHDSYFQNINDILVPYMVFNKNQKLVGIEWPLQLSKVEKKEIMSYLWKIEVNRRVILSFYPEIIDNVKDIRSKIKEVIDID